MGGIQWSQTRPDFELAGQVLPTDDRYPERIDDLYGADHCFAFTSGSLEDIASFHSAIVMMRVGGSNFRELAGEGVITQYLARQVFPLHREGAISGLLKTPEAPSVEELEVFAGGLMHTLELRPAAVELTR